MRSLAIASLALLLAGRSWSAEPEEKTPAAPAPAPEPAIKLSAGEVIVYSFTQLTRNRFGAGKDQISEERGTQGTLTLYVLEALKDGGWRVAVVSDLEDAYLRGAPGGGEGKPVKTRWQDAAFIRLGADLQRAEGSEFGRAPVVGSSTAELPEDAPAPPVAALPFPLLSTKDLTRTEAWQTRIAALAPFGGLTGGQADLGVENEKSKDHPGLVLFMRLIPGEPTTYTEKFMVDPEARKLASSEFVYHMCGSGGNSRQETRLQEKSRATLDAKELAELSTAAAELETAAKLLRTKPDEARKQLAALKEKMPKSPFVPAIEAAIGKKKD